MASLPSPHRQRTSFFPTPLIGDVLFSERVVCQTKAVPAYGTAHPNAARWPNHKLVFAKERPEPESVDSFDFYYAADRSSQDSYNFSHTKADIGGTKFDAVARTYVTLRSAFTPNTPAMGAAMPNTPAGLFPGDYVLAEKRQTRIGEQELDNLYVAETHVYVKRCTITQLGIDPINGEVLTSTSTLYYASEVVTGSTTAATLFASPSNAYWGLQSTGVQRTGKQLSCEWYEITSEVIVAGELSDGATTIRSYSSSQNYYWPPILNYVDIRVWEKRNGRTERYSRPVYTKEGYRGECKTDIVDTFHTTAPAVSAPSVMIPLPINIQNPYYSLSISPCLFAGATYSFTNGTEDPDYEYTVDQYVFPATSPTVWPAFVTIVNVQPFRGGYLKSTIKIYKPS